MATITFDTLKYVERLKAGGAPKAQAKAEAEALSAALGESVSGLLATRNDVNCKEHRMIEHDSKLTLLQGMAGFNLAFTMAVPWKVFV